MGKAISRFSLDKSFNFRRRSSRKKKTKHEDFQRRHSVCTSSGTNSSMPRPTLLVTDWLDRLGLKHYVQLFSAYTGVEDILHMDEGDLKTLGIKNGAERARMASSLVVLKEKWVRGGPPCDVPNTLSKTRPKSEVCHSKKMDPPTPCLPTLDPVEQKKILDWELSLDSCDLRSHAWYHGTIPRQRSEMLLKEDGDFLVRDCTSKPGDFVLSCRWKQQALHFVINKVLLQPETVYERIQFQFEEDSFDNISDLVTFYVGNGKLISSASKAKIHQPINRTHPLSYASSAGQGLHYELYSVSGGTGNSLARPGAVPIYGQIKKHSHYKSYNSPVHTPSHSPPRLRRDAPPKIPPKSRNKVNETDPSPTRTLTPMKDSTVDSHSSDGVVGLPSNRKSSLPNVVLRQTFHSLPRKLSHSNQRNRLVEIVSDDIIQRAPPSSVRRYTKRDDDDEDSDFADLPDNPPPKPGRKPVINPDPKMPLNVLYDAIKGRHGNEDLSLDEQNSLKSKSDYAAPPRPISETDSGIAIYDSQSSASGVVQNSSKCNKPSETCDSVIGADPSQTDSGPMLYNIPNLEPSSFYDLELFETLLLPSDNKPLDPTALEGVKNTLLERGARVIACHITKVDLQVANIDNEEDLGFGVTSGIELCTLPHGKQLRLDLIERSECLKYFVASTILTAPPEDRHNVLHKWIQIAVEAKTSLGNLFSFAAIMMGLNLPQVTRLHSTWNVLRQRHTESAYTFESKLRATFNEMNDCQNPQAPNTTIPYILPFLMMLERQSEELAPPGENTNNNSIFNWEVSSQDFGLNIFLAHLAHMRQMCHQVKMFRRNSSVVLGDVTLDELTLDMFKTEFHLRLLWGSKGARANITERYIKFDQLLSLMSEQVEEAQPL